MIPSTSSRHRKVSNRWNSSRGFAVLATAVALIVISLIITLGAAIVASNEQKSSGNQVRNQQANSASESGIERGMSYLRQNLTQVRSTTANGWNNTSSTPRWTLCVSGTLVPPCGDGKQNLYDANWTSYSAIPNLTATGETLPDTFITHYVALAAGGGSAAPAGGIYQVQSEGTSADTLGKALIRQSLVFQPILAHRPDAPLIAAGSIGLSGTVSIVANPNGGGSGVPLSAWSKTNINEGGSMQTCHIFEFLTTNSTFTTQTDANGNEIKVCPACECPNAVDQTITQKNTEGIDILDVDGNVGANRDSSFFPSDLFQYLFGVPEADYLSIKSVAQIITDCGTLNAASAGLYWIVGNCSIPANTTVGSFAAPVLLVVENGNFQMNANSAFFGVLFAFAQGAGAVDVKLTGGPTLYGAMLSNRNIDTGNGNYTARYDKIVLDNLANGAAAPRRLALVPGSWRDY